MKQPIRRIRIRYHGDVNPPRWASYYDPPGSVVCLYWTQTLESMWLLLDEYFKNEPLRVQPHMMKFVNSEKHRP